MHSILVDSDVILDLFLLREPHHTVALQFFSYIEQNPDTITAYVSPLAIANVAYILTKAKSQSYAVQKIKGLTELLSVASMTPESVSRAIADPHKDFEDAMQYYCARDNELGTIVTRNSSDYPKENLRVVTPQEFMAMDIVERST